MDKIYVECPKYESVALKTRFDPFLFLAATNLTEIIK